MDAMNPWPALAPYAKTLSIPGEGELFYYDSEGDADSEGNADSEGDADTAGINTETKPTIVLVHGLADEADTWRHIFPLLSAAGYRVIAPDLPGFGRSVWKGRINLSCQYKAVIRLMDATGAASAEKPAVFAGSSLGASIVEMVAGKRPELVKGLVLLNGCFPFEYKLDGASLLMMLPFVGKSWYRSFRNNHEGAWRSLYPYYGNLDAMSEADKTFLRQRVIARVESSNQERGYFATLRSINASLLFGSKRAAARKAQALPGKIVMIWGDTDRVFPQKRAELFRRLRPDAEFIVITDAGHLPHQEKPDVCAAEILQFLQAVN